MLTLYKSTKVLDPCQEIEREKNARLDLERRASAESAAVSEKTPIARQNSAFENGMMLCFYEVLGKYFVPPIHFVFVQEAYLGSSQVLAALAAWRKVIFCKHHWTHLTVYLIEKIL